MGLYSHYIFPRLLEMALSARVVGRFRNEVLADVSGEILEIGFGTGLNLPHYPDRVKKIATLDTNRGMNKWAARRISASQIEVVQHLLSAERLPFPDNSFDSVVSTWTLCSIKDVQQALIEIARVLKPGGRFYFIEHGLCPDAAVQRWQHRLNPLQQIVADGCNINRDISKLVAENFQIDRLKNFYLDQTPRILGYQYQGIGVKSNSK